VRNGDGGLVRLLLADHEKLRGEEEDRNVDAEKREEREVLHRNERRRERLCNVEVPAKKRVRVEVSVFALNVALGVVLVVSVSPPRRGAAFDKPFKQALNAVVHSCVARDANVTAIVLHVREERDEKGVSERMWGTLNAACASRGEWGIDNHRGVCVCVCVV
jgi:hypothetical protein